MAEGTSAPTPESIARSLASGTTAFKAVAGKWYKGRKFEIQGKQYSLYKLIEYVQKAAFKNQIDSNQLKTAVQNLLKLNITPPFYRSRPIPHTECQETS